MFSVIIPCFHAPAYLDLCLRSALEGQTMANQFVVVIDGCEAEYASVLARYAKWIFPVVLPVNEGLCMALNKGVLLAESSRLLLINEDNVLPPGWDQRLLQEFQEDLVLTINQIEPEGKSIFDHFLQHSFGTRAEDFDLMAFQAWEPAQAVNERLPDGRIFPFTCSKRLYLTVGGFDPLYPSPHYCDMDFFFKLELMPGVRFGRTRRLHFYHFGQKSTSNPDASPEVRDKAARRYLELGKRACELFERKWGLTAQRDPEHSLLPKVRYQNGIRYTWRHEDIKLATIINFCTNEARFIDACITQALRFSSQVLVPVCDHFFDGQPEDLEQLKNIANTYPEAYFCGFTWETEPKPPWYWPSLARVVGLSHLEPDIEYVLFIDADEIVDGERMHDWLTQGCHKPWNALTLSNYWYFREPRYQALRLEDSAVLISRQHLKEAVIMDQMERYAILNSIQGPRKRELMGLDGLPLVHHYSWVRSKQEMLRKVRSWSHREDRDWESQVEAEFSHPFNGKDFVHGYEFREVEPFIQLTVNS